MKIVLLSGGSGTRLWPLSNDLRSKQFIKMFKGPDGKEESMLQRTYRQIHTMLPNTEVIIAASKGQAAVIKSQLGENVDLCLEPCRKDTFPAVTLAAAYLYEEKHVNKDECIVVCPVDSYVEDEYFKKFEELFQIVETTDSNITLMGIEPTYPTSKYGYILPKNQGKKGIVNMFREKPDEETARKYISQGALWNGGVFAFRLGYMLEKGHEIINFTDYAELYAKYNMVEAVAFNHAVVEKEAKLSYLRYEGTWKALGTWSTLTESMDENCVGQAVFDDTCARVHVVNELNVPILCMGVSDLIVSASPEGILVSDKRCSSGIKPYVEKISQQVMFAEKSWGTFQVIDMDDSSMTIKVSLKPGQHMNYHSHMHRDEVWTVLMGEGKTVVDGMEQPVHTGDVITMQAGCRHTVIAKTALTLIEVQLGKEISVHDKRKYDYEF